jgi:hypothetical protein
MKYLQLRAGYMVQSFQMRTIDGKDKLFVNQDSFLLGPSAGVTIGIPLAKKGKGNQILLFDYGYRFTHFWKGNHFIGLRINL